MTKQRAHLVAEHSYVRSCIKDTYPQDGGYDIPSTDQELCRHTQASKPRNSDEDEQVHDADDARERHGAEEDTGEEEPAAPYAAGRWELVDPLPGPYDRHG